MFSYSSKCTANFPSKTQHEQKTSTPRVQTTFPLYINQAHLIRRRRTGGAKLGLCLAAQSHSCVRLYTALCQPATRQSHKQKKRVGGKKKKKWGSISRPLAFCLNSSSLRLSISLSLPSIYIKDGGERRGGSQAQQKGEMQSNRQVMNRARGAEGAAQEAAFHLLTATPQRGRKGSVWGRDWIGLERGRA